MYLALENKASTPLLAIRLEIAVRWCAGRGLIFQLAIGCLCYTSEAASFQSN